MTTSYNLSKKQLPKLLILPGLNNNEFAFNHLKEYFLHAGYDVNFIQLPGQGELRSEMDHFNLAFESFKQSMNSHTESPYVIIAFSTGALYYQHWLNENPQKMAKAQFLLAPALRVQHQNLVDKFLNILPEKFPLPSRSPKPFQKYPTLSVKEYQTLFSGLRLLEELKTDFPIPTKIVIDRRDELVDVNHLKKRYANYTRVLERNCPVKKLGVYHLLFHPDYFENNEWEVLMKEIQDFFSTNAEA